MFSTGLHTALVFSVSFLFQQVNDWHKSQDLMSSDSPVPCDVDIVASNAPNNLEQSQESTHNLKDTSAHSNPVKVEFCSQEQRECAMALTSLGMENEQVVQFPYL